MISDEALRAIVDSPLSKPVGVNIDGSPGYAIVFSADLARALLEAREVLRVELADLESRFQFTPRQTEFVEKALAMQKVTLAPCGRRSGKSTYQRLARIRACLPEHWKGAPKPGVAVRHDDGAYVPKRIRHGKGEA